MHARTHTNKQTSTFLSISFTFLLIVFLFQVFRSVLLEARYLIKVLQAAVILIIFCFCFSMLNIN